MMQKKNKRGQETSDSKEKLPISARLGSILDIPTDLLRGGCYLELRGQNDLRLQGCRRIAAYDESEIVLRLRRGHVKVLGRGLGCSSYHAGCVVISGWITGIEFLGTEEKA